MDSTKQIRNTSRRGWAQRAPMFHAALIVATLCAAGMIWLAEQSWYKLTHIVSERENLQLVHTATSETTAELLVAESGQRGFLLTNDPQFLDTYQKAIGRIARQLTFLHETAPPVVQQSVLMTQFITQAEDELRRMALALHLAQAQKAPDAAKIVVDSSSSPEQVYDFRAGSKRLTSLIDALITKQQVHFEQVLNTSRLILFLCVLLAWISFILYVRQTQRLQDAVVQRQKMLERRSERWETLAHGRAEQLAELATYLQRAAETERSRLAQELHDELGSLMTAAKLVVARLKSHAPADDGNAQKHLAHLDELLGQSIALGRRIIENLRPSSLSTLGLTAALDTLASEWHASSGIDIRTTIEEVDIAPDQELTVYRLVQEALTNISKYAQAKQVKVTLKVLAEQIEIAVTDDGKGFDPEDIAYRARGLAGMRHRLEACGGSLSIHSAPGHGTRIIGVLARDAKQP